MIMVFYPILSPFFYPHYRVKTQTRCNKRKEKTENVRQDINWSTILIIIVKNYKKTIQLTAVPHLWRLSASLWLLKKTRHLKASFEPHKKEKEMLAVFNGFLQIRWRGWGGKYLNKTLVEAQQLETTAEYSKRTPASQRNSAGFQNDFKDCFWTVAW